MTRFKSGPISTSLVLLCLASLFWAQSSQSQTQPEIPSSGSSSGSGSGSSPDVATTIESQLKPDQYQAPAPIPAAIRDSNRRLVSASTTTTTQTQTTTATATASHSVKPELIEHLFRQQNQPESFTRAPIGFDALRDFVNKYNVTKPIKLAQFSPKQSPTNHNHTIEASNQPQTRAQTQTQTLQSSLAQLNHTAATTTVYSSTNPPTILASQVRPTSRESPNARSQVNPLLIFTVRNEIRSIDIFNLTAKPSAPLDFQDPSSPYDLPTSFTLSSSSHLQNANKNSRTLMPGLKNSIGLDFYYSDTSPSYIYWSDVIEEKIYRGVFNSGSIVNVEVVLHSGLATAEGLAVDWEANNIYWVESTLDHIEVATMNGTSRRTLIAGDMDSPRAIALDPRYGLLFWSDWDKKNPRIERATMSGDDRRNLFEIKDVSGGWPNGLTLDYSNLKVYWIDASSNSIHSIDYEGKNYQHVMKHVKSLGHPFSITLFGDNLFWTDWKNNSVSMASKRDGSGLRELQRLPNRLFDIKVFHPNRQPRMDVNLNPCYRNNGGCSHLCLLSTNHTRKCECPNLMRLTEDGLTCKRDEHVLLIGKTNEIRAVDAEEPLRHIMAPISIPKVFSPKQFDFLAKNRTIFWVDSQANEIKKTQLEDYNIDTIIDVIIESPSGLALDWISKNLYITSAPQPKSYGKIYLSNLNGEFISIVMDKSDGLISPKSIAVHPKLGLLFCISEDREGDPIIFYTTMNGGSMNIIASKSKNFNLQNPASLAIDYYTDRVYWINQASSDQDNASIQYYDISNHQVVTFLDERNTPEIDRINATTICVDREYLIVSGRHPKEAIFKFNKEDSTNRTPLRTQNLDQLSALRVYDASFQNGTNACAQNNGNCSQLCVPISSTRRACRCAIGYATNPQNETQCIGKDSFLLYSYNMGIRGVSLQPETDHEDYYSPPIHRAFRASSIDYVYQDGLIYWVDHEEGSITRINRDTTNYQIIAQSLESEESIAIDYVAGNIYWLDPYYDVIEVARLNGSSRYVIISGDMEKANNIVVDPWIGRIAWSDVGSLPKIESAKLDGSDRKVIVNSSLTHVDDLAVDRDQGFIYWLDSSVISRVRFDGSERTIVLQSSSQGTNSPLVSIAIYDQNLYMADSVTDQGSITRFNLSSNMQEIIHRGLGQGIKDICIFAHQKLPSSDHNPCVKNNGGCQDLCLFTGVPGHRRCICSHGELMLDMASCRPYSTFVLYSKSTQIDTLHVRDDDSLNNSPFPPIVSENGANIIAVTVDYASQRVIYSEMSQPERIASIFFNGTDRQILVEKQSFVEGIAFANGELYWTNNNDQSISRLNTSSSGVLKKSCDSNQNCVNATVEKIIQLSHEDKPRGIAVDICTSYVYWTNWNVNAAIQRANPHDNFKVESIITTAIKLPNGIAIDQPSRRLFWCDAKLDKIESSEMDGTGRIVLVHLSPQHPFGLAIGENYIFWTDWLARGVYRADKYTGEEPMQIKKLALRPMGIAVAVQEKFQCQIDLCDLNNGGCPAEFTCVQHEYSASSKSVRCISKLASHNLSQPQSIIQRCGSSKDGHSCSYNYHEELMDVTGRYKMSTQQVIHLQQEYAADETDREGGKEYRQEITTAAYSLTPKEIQPSVLISKHWDNGSNDSSEPVHSQFNSTTVIYNTTSTTSTDEPSNASKTYPPILHPTPVTMNTSQNSAPTQSTSLGPIEISTVKSTPDNEHPKTTTQDTTPTTQEPIPKVISLDTKISPDKNISQPCHSSSESQIPITTTVAIPPEKNDCKFTDQIRCHLSEKVICLQSKKWCDGIPDCPGKEDEDNCYLSNHGPAYELKRETGWRKSALLVVLGVGAALGAILLIFRPRSFNMTGRRRYWFVGPKSPFSHRRMFDENGTNIEISNPMFDEDDTTGSMPNCPFSIDLSERTTNFSNPLYERQVLLMGDKNVV